MSVPLAMTSNQKLPAVVSSENSALAAKVPAAMLASVQVTYLRFAPSMKTSRNSLLTKTARTAPLMVVQSLLNVNSVLPVATSSICARMVALTETVDSTQTTSVYVPLVAKFWPTSDVSAPFELDRNTVVRFGSTWPRSFDTTPLTLSALDVPAGAIHFVSCGEYTPSGRGPATDSPTSAPLCVASCQGAGMLPGVPAAYCVPRA